MATITKEDQTRVSLKLLVDKKRNRVVVAEASKDFVDILFSFLALPMGKIIQILRNQENPDMFCVYHLYQSVENLSDDTFSKINFSNEVSKSSLLNPRNRFEDICINLKVNIDESSPNLENLHPPIKKENMENISSSGGVFLKGGMFLISDNLLVTSNSPGILVQHLSSFGITDMTQVTKISVEAGKQEISRLLKCSLISKCPLTDVFLVTQRKSDNLIMPEPRNFVPPSFEALDNEISTCRFRLKLVLTKSTNRVLCAEAGNTFVNFLFSFLTIPIGLATTLLHGQTGLECIDNLHRSVENLESNLLRIEKESLLKPDFDSDHGPLRILETVCQEQSVETAHAEELLADRFVETPSSFFVSDNLVIKDLSTTSCIDLLGELNVSICDIEERTVTVGEPEALGILKASFTSSSALTDGLNSLLKKHTREIRLKKEQEENKRRYKAQEHLYTIIKVARDEDLREQIGKDIYFDLVDHDKVRSFWIKNQSPFNLFKEVVAKEFCIPVQFQRFWTWAKRQNHTYRPYRPLTAHQEVQTVGQLREVTNKTQNAEIKLFLEVEYWLDLRPIPPPKMTEEDILIFFKFYDPKKEELRFVGRSFVRSSGQPNEILTKLNELVGFPPEEDIELFEEIMFEPNVTCERLDKSASFRFSQIEDGDIICFQKRLPPESEEQFRFPDVPSFLGDVKNRQIAESPCT